MLTPNSEMKRRKASESWGYIAARAERLHHRLASVSGAIIARSRDIEGAELLEFGLALPLILVMLVGLLDFSHAYNVKQKLANAAREGARAGASQPNDIFAAVPPSIPAVKDVVINYLSNAGLNTSFISSTLTYNSTTYTGTYYTTTSSGATYGLEIERNYTFTDSSGTTIQATRVTLSYPYNWGFGFNQIIKLLIPSAAFGNPITIETDATMQNLD